MSVLRMAGPDRIATAIVVSQQEFPAGGAPAAVLVGRDSSVDAVAGTVLAAAKGGPLLVTTGDAMDPRVSAELERALTPGSPVYLMGGADALGAAVSAAVASLGFAPVRLGGQDRYQSALLADAFASAKPGVVVLADGIGYADAAVAAVAAAHVRGVVLLTDDAALPPADSAYLALRPGTPVVAVGGPASRADLSAEALAGSDAAGTARLVAERLFTGPTVVAVADGTDLSDALAGGVEAARAGGPLLWSEAGELPPASDGYLAEASSTITSVLLLGGQAVLSDAVVQEVMAALGLSGAAVTVTGPPVVAGAGGAAGTGTGASCTATVVTAAQPGPGTGVTVVAGGPDGSTCVALTSATP